MKTDKKIENQTQEERTWEINRDRTADF
jgi:hypothetical protein